MAALLLENLDRSYITTSYLCHYNQMKLKGCRLYIIASLNILTWYVLKFNVGHHHSFHSVIYATSKGVTHANQWHPLACALVGALVSVADNERGNNKLNK